MRWQSAAATARAPIASAFPELVAVMRCTSGWLTYLLALYRFQDSA